MRSYLVLTKMTTASAIYKQKDYDDITALVYIIRKDNKELYKQMIPYICPLFKM